jgi:hypothetical protein
MGNATEAALACSVREASEAGFRDGLGERVIVPGGQGELVNVLYLRPELTAVSSFEFALRERCARLASFRHTSYAHVRQIDRLTPPDGDRATAAGHADGRLAIVSDHVPGWRLAEILSVAHARRLELDVNAALSLVRQLVHAVAILHRHARGVAHGALAPERLIVTTHARLVVVEYVLGSAFERLEMTRERLWRDYRLAVPPAAGGTRFDHRADVTQLGAVALALVLGRPLTDDEYPHQIADLLAAATENRTTGGRQPLSKPLRTWLARALQLDLRHSFSSALEAESALEALLGEEPCYVAVPIAIESFLASYQKSSPPAPTEPARDPDTPAPRVMVTPLPPTVPAIDLAEIIARIDSIDDGANSQAQPAQEEPVSLSGLSAKSEPVTDGYPGAFESLFGGTTKPDEPAPVPGADDHDPANVEEPRAGGRILRLVLGLLALVALGAGGYAIVRAASFTAVPPADGTLSVESRPAGVPVTIDGTPRGVTPLKIALPPGPHRLELLTAGEARLIPINVTAGGQISHYIEATAAPVSGRLQVISEPPGATVIVDGERKGIAPLVVTDLPAGRHRIELQSDAGTVQQEVTINAGATSSLVVPVTPKDAPLSGWVAVTSPVGLQIFEGGQLVGTTQTERILMTAGRHDLELVNETLDFRGRQSVQVGPGKVVPLRVQLPTGSLNVNAIPWAEVFIDGERKGETPLGNLSLSIGPHEVVFRHPQFGEQRQAIVVKAGAPARVSVDLRK